MKVALDTATSPKVVKTVTVGKTVAVGTRSIKIDNAFRVGGRDGHSGSPTKIVSLEANVCVESSGSGVSKLTVGKWSSIGTTLGAVVRLVVMEGVCPSPCLGDTGYCNEGHNRSRSMSEKGTSLSSIALNVARALLQSVAPSNTNEAVVMDGTLARQGTEEVGFDSF